MSSIQKMKWSSNPVFCMLSERWENRVVFKYQYQETWIKTDYKIIRNQVKHKKTNSDKTTVYVETQEVETEEFENDGK